MLIKKDYKIINFRTVEAVVKDKTNLRFVMTSDCHIDFKFESNELRDKAFDQILDAYRWQRLVCDLG